MFFVIVRPARESALASTGSAADPGPPAALISVRPISAAATVYGGLPNVPVTLSQHHLHMLFAA